MSNNVIRFPGFLIVGRNTILKDGNSYPSIAALIADLPHSDLKRAHHWYNQRSGPLGYRVRCLRDALYGPHQQEGVA